MRVIALCTSAVIAFAVPMPALAQPSKGAKTAPAANEVRYFTSLSGVMDDSADTVLKETRSGGRVTAAVLDVCYPASPGSDLKDRFVATLTVEAGQKLTGSTQSIGGKQPVTVALTRKTSADGVAFTGKITVGDRVSNVTSEDNTDISEKEFREGQEQDDEIAASPAAFTTVSPESIAVRLKPEAVLDFVATLRGESLQVSLPSLIASCSELRKGEQTVRIAIDPARAGEFLGKIRTAPGVTIAGWTSGRFEMERVVRFDAAEWRSTGQIDRTKLAAMISATVAKALEATASTSAWDEDTGELKLTFKRPYAALAPLKLTQSLDLTFIVSGEKPGTSDRLLLWTGYPQISTGDESTGAKLKLTETDSSEESVPADDSDMITALARELKAQRWDTDKSIWK